jgi:hypothetical protein
MYTLKEKLLWYPLYIMAIVGMYFVGLFCVLIERIAKLKNGGR